MEGWRRPKKFSFAGGLVEGALVVMYFALAFQLALPDTAQEYFLIYRMVRSRAPGRGARGPQSRLTARATGRQPAGFAGRH